MLFLILSKAKKSCSSTGASKKLLTVSIYSPIIRPIYFLIQNKDDGSQRTTESGRTRAFTN